MPAVLLVAFLIVPIVEIYVIIQVGQLIGAVPTVLLLIAESVLGAWLVKREGRRAWDALRGALGTGRLPGRELADAALVLIGGTLLLTPGFVTDVVGFALILPVTRPLARRLLGWLVARRATAAATRRFGPVARARGSRDPGLRDQPLADPGVPDPGAGPPGSRIVPGEVVKDPDQRPPG